MCTDKSFSQLGLGGDKCSANDTRNSKGFPSSGNPTKIVFNETVRTVGKIEAIGSIQQKRLIISS